jgi:hypothetical protein
MDKFTSLKNKENKEISKKDKDIVFKDGFLSIIKKKDYLFVSEKDIAICIPFLIEQNKIIVRQEVIPSYEYTDGNHEHLALVGGQIEKGESPEMAMLRELEEEAGIILRDNYRLIPLKPLFISKGNSSKYYPFLINLTETDYQESKITPKGKLERMSSTIKLDLKYLNALNTSDLITDYLITKFKIENNLI